MIAAVNGLREEYTGRGDEPADELLLHLLGLTLERDHRLLAIPRAAGWR